MQLRDNTTSHPMSISACNPWLSSLASLFLFPLVQADTLQPLRLPYWYKHMHPMPATPSLPTECSINAPSVNAVYPSCIMQTSRAHRMGCDPIGRITPAGPKYSILKPRLLAFETALIQLRGLWLFTFPLVRSLCGRQVAEIAP
ncbi:uncharacterized protein TrAFT101_004000 [Trichoderma asperellum]|nr:hypothetical protein TrAFT101_004000 [Trichoderma asperellum]